MRVAQLFAAAAGGATLTLLCVWALFELKGSTSLSQFWRDPCRGACGESTVCENGRCQAKPTAPKARTRGRKGPAKPRRTRARRRARAQQPTQLPWANDRHVPRFNAKAVQRIGADDASGRLDTFDIDQVLDGLQPAWMECVERADARSGGALANGRVKISFGVNGAGTVTGVNARAPAALKKYGLVPCVRLAIFGARFPAYRGPVTRVNTHFDVSF